MSLRMSVKQTSPKTINSGLVTTDSLTALGIGNPVTLDKFITLEYKSRYGSEGFSDFLSTSGRKKVVSKAEDGIYRWKLQGATAKSIPLTECLIDGNAIGDVGNIVLRDRKILSEDGIFIIAITINRREKKIIYKKKNSRKKYIN